MNRTKWMAFLSVVVFIAGFSACGGGSKYGEVTKIMEKSAKIMENFIARLEKADSGSKVAAAINAFADDMEKLKPKMMELEQKFPELKDESNLPAELAPIMKKSSEMWQRMGAAMMKVMQHSDDPEVKKAQERLQKIIE